MELFKDFYDVYHERDKCVHSINYCEFVTDKDELGVYALMCDNDMYYIGKTNKSFESRLHHHLDELYKYWHRRYNKKSLRTKPNYNKLYFLTRELLLSNKILVKKLSSDPSDESLLIKKHKPYCNIMCSPVSIDEIKFRRKTSIQSLRALKTQYDLYSFLN